MVSTRKEVEAMREGSVKDAAMKQLVEEEGKAAELKLAIAALREEEPKVKWNILPRSHG